MTDATDGRGLLPDYHWTTLGMVSVCAVMAVIELWEGDVSLGGLWSVMGFVYLNFGEIDKRQRGTRQ